MLSAAGPARRRSHRPRLARRVLTIVAAALLAAACSSSGSGSSSPSGEADRQGPSTTRRATTSTTLEAPSGDAFYRPPDPLPPGEPGDVIWTEPMESAEGSKAWRVLYHSRTIQGRDIAVSGSVVAPDREPPAGGFPVIAWAHGTTGGADVCAPSKREAGGAPYQDALIDAGYVIAATDYEGLGGPGPHPYLVGGSEGRGVLDAARAARQLDAGVGRSVLVWGHSQGGHAAMFAGQLAESYARELDVVGVVGGAPASELEVLFVGASSIPRFFGFVATAGYGWSAAYPEADIEKFMTDKARSLLPVVEQECLTGVLAAFNLPRDELLVGDPLVTEPWPRLIEENTVGHADTVAPILIVQGGMDQLVPKVTTDALVARLCQRGTTLEYRTYPEEDHTSVIPPSRDVVLKWIADRFEHRAATSTCA